MPNDVFPQTLQTWIGRQLQRGIEARPDLNRHLMNTYAWPLKVYFLGTSSRHLGEADDVINGFFESRLSQQDFLNKWRITGMPLRRWLMNSFSFYLMELRRQQKRRQRESDLIDDQASHEPDIKSIHRAEACSMVRQAMSQAQHTCEKEGLSQHWNLFVRRYLEDAPLPDVAREYGVDAARASVMCRTACRKFRSALRDVLILDGADPDEIETEIGKMLQDCCA